MSQDLWADVDSYVENLFLPDDPAEEHAAVHDAMRDALAAGMRGELPAQGPRGGKIWSPRFFVRYVAWHTLDHAWEIEDRAIWNAG